MYHDVFLHFCKHVLPLICSSPPCIHFHHLMTVTNSYFKVKAFDFHFPVDIQHSYATITALNIQYLNKREKVSIAVVSLTCAAP